ncbi:hypothetical protein D9M69_663350 [compost metagenome]
MLATLQALTVLHSPGHISLQSRRHQELRAAHAGAIAEHRTASERLAKQYGDSRSGHDALVKAFGEERAQEITAERQLAYEAIGIHHRELQKFHKENPHIAVISQFLEERAS